jgi:hypothetical protein
MGTCKTGTVLFRLGGRGKWSLSTPYPAGSMSLLTTWRGNRSVQIGLKSMT